MNSRERPHHFAREQDGARYIIFVVLCFFSIGSAGWSQLPARDQCPTPNTERMIAYKFLAELAYHRVQTKQYDEATRAAENLEFTFDETSGCLQTMGVTPAEAVKIDHLMDNFIGLVRDAANTDPGKVTQAYKAFTEEVDRSITPAK